MRNYGTAYRTATSLVCLMALTIFSPPATAEDNAGSETKEVTDFKTLKSPIPYTKKSIARGKGVYTRYCTACHGPDGKSQIDVIADATDLTVPKFYFSGSSEGEVFHSIRDGAGVAMPPYKLDIRREDDIWHLVNFIQSLWPASERPTLHEETTNEQPAEDGGSDSE